MPDQFQFSVIIPVISIMPDNQRRHNQALSIDANRLQGYPHRRHTFSRPLQHQKLHNLSRLGSYPILTLIIHKMLHSRDTPIHHQRQFVRPARRPTINRRHDLLSSSLPLLFNTLRLKLRITTTNKISNFNNRHPGCYKCRNAVNRTTSPFFDSLIFTQGSTIATFDSSAIYLHNS